MLKSITILSACTSFVCIQAQAQKLPRFGVDPIDKVISAMTLDEKLDILIGSDGNINTSALATIGVREH